MGLSSSTQQHNVSTEQREIESVVASTGSLPLLKNCFSTLADPHTNLLSLQSLQKCFSLSYKPRGTPDCFPRILDQLGPSIVEIFFISHKNNNNEGGFINWVDFLRGYLKCCGRAPVSVTLNALLRVFLMTGAKVGLNLKLEFECGDDGGGDYGNCKISGFVLPADVRMLLWVCWTMLWDSRASRLLKGRENLCVPYVDHLVLSAVVSCAEVGDKLNLWDCDILELDVQLPAGKFLTWVLTTVPSLTDCFVNFVNARLQHCVTLEEDPEPSSSQLGEISSRERCNTCLLTLGRAWAISLTLRGTLSVEILRPFFCSSSDGSDENLLYRSSLHGRGLNGFWSNIEGYHGPLLILVSATSGHNNYDSSDVRKWIIGALTQQGFENRDIFYGSSGSLFAVFPVFHVLSPSGKEKNFVYSHLHPTGKVYEPHPKPVGIAFGGTIGNERIFIDEDFAKIIVRHHAFDKTYRAGPLFPHQGFLPVEAVISEVEVWGLGGERAKEVQTSYKKREELFIEQRRKVDLKTFANWEDSPEKMMMDMMSNPNQIRKEDR